MVNQKLEKIGMTSTKSKMTVNNAHASGFNIKLGVDNGLITKRLKELREAFLQKNQLIITTKKPLWTVGKK